MLAWLTKLYKIWTAWVGVFIFPPFQTLPTPTGGNLEVSWSLLPAGTVEFSDPPHTLTFFMLILILLLI
ncbi:hypothetical protein [Sulfurihydrogenibium sp.]|uniref:hypothetical protein n=1 Tax=Sulfurihydrogenibium sp. TaxID=2053621 RepID=UPI00261557EC|nr:hypothetical protein [Sulfurihydrogenibium sp.]